MADAHSVQISLDVDERESYIRGIVELFSYGIGILLVYGNFDLGHSDLRSALL